MDVYSFICGTLAGLGVLLLILLTLLVFIQGLRRRSWALTLAGFFMCYIVTLLIDAIVYRMTGAPK